MVELFVEALNSPGGIPVIGSTWQRVLEATYTDGTGSALSTYKEMMVKVSKQLPMESDQLLLKHRKAVDESISTFNKAVSLDSESELYQVYLDKLMVSFCCIVLIILHGWCCSLLLKLIHLARSLTTKLCPYQHSNFGSKF